ncbi:helix-turn-helix transcriptional regulator [Ancylobacter sp. MQZ15Z-1]|uniref:Helix-turn-helix transcriptional regulator n=2 Tax=Ancylobacter mangrovi TaxID=2972472 RepID=A0A9X2PD39_9HYPH|nr:helix-turn-helix transcriptional regulator [Ancylobacter mangrovi]
MTDMTPSHHECTQIGELLGRIGDRWTLRVAVALNDGPLRFNRIRRAVEGISQQMLTRTLKALERDGMVTRTVHPTVPPQVEYKLTPLGLSLAAEGMRLGSWVREHLSEIDTRRAEFDAREPR